VARRWFRFPVWRRSVGKEEGYEWPIPLHLRKGDGTFTPSPFLFESGSLLTSIPIAEAERLQIPFDRQRPVTIRGATGTGQGFLGPLWFSLAGLPEYQFQCLCCFSAAGLPRCLLSLKDVLAHFRLRTLLPSRLHPLGSRLLQLHGRHKGQPRTS
jgi:hypothetical protein